MNARLESIVVQIRSLDNTKLAGAGFIVDLDGIIATCLHVLRDAGVDPITLGATVGIGLADQKERFSASVVAMLKSDDVCLLQLNQVIPYGWSSTLLGISMDSYGHPFISKGYPKLGRYVGVRAEGRILGSFESVEGSSPPEFPLLQLSSQQIQEGMSGAPVLDIESNYVVGMITEYWVPPSGFRHRDTSFACPSEALVATMPERLRFMPAPTSTESITQAEEDMAELIQLKGYRVLGRLKSETGLLFECETSVEGTIKRVLISVVMGEPKPADIERLNQTLAAYNVGQGIILGSGEK